MSMEGLNVLRGAQWLADLKHELMTFPAGKHDDQVDALSLFGQLLDLLQSGKTPKEETAKPKELVYEAKPDGSVIGNMSVREAVEARMRRKRQEG